MVRGVVVAGLEIVEAGFGIVVVATVAQGVPVGKGGAGGLLIHQAVAVAVGYEAGRGALVVQQVNASRPLCW